MSGEDADGRGLFYGKKNSGDFMGNVYVKHILAGKLDAYNKGLQKHELTKLSHPHSS